MSTLTYNSCLLVTNSNADDFGIQPSDKDIKALNKRLKWQIENLNRGLRYIPVNLIDAKLMLGFILMLINKSTDVNNAFTICGNVIHYSLIKYKRVTRSVLASKIYGIIITKRLSLLAVPLVVCTDLYSLYECLINGEDNPTDAFTKASPNRALERFINSNKVIVRIKGWVQRPTISA
ncbi:hypothetical protein BU23DRAFT_580578 [Bimuria novae-zelandiae CBS 107.79]|uniref:Uncharacterized protein n=1 Tax=Bimuria novae-zelandiae CBS 107.79 TaxID=1447943 RepID=A0A6A5V6J7_9PLEO|nr:hypothetical protein BU23DRAFT_580578 [Bimuria novae-zelandiae CBS 107.79]